MNEEGSKMKHADAKVQTKRGFSIIWVVPIIALLIGGWLFVKDASERGPIITISFETAEGLEAGNTKIKFKDVEIGKVTAITLNDDRSGVVVTAEMNKDTQSYMNDETHFWVVRAKVAAGEVSGLGTLLSGAYIGCNPSSEGKKASHYLGLEKPPLITTDMPGRHFTLQADELGSLDRGAPVYHRGIKVGQIVDYDFNLERDGVDIKLFVKAPFHEKVFQNTRFWNASGVNLTMNASGVTLDTQSLISIMLGGVAFDLPKHHIPGGPAAEESAFQLYKNRENIEEEIYTLKRYYMLYFEQNVRGLSLGAPVEMKGIHIGEVVDIKLELNEETLEVRIPVLIMIEPERLDVLVTNKGVITNEKEIKEELAKHRKSIYELGKDASRGAAAQLKTGNLLTGQLYITIDFYPDVAPVELDSVGMYEVIPTIQQPLEEITESISRILKKVEKIPFDEIGGDLKVTVETLTKTLEEVTAMSGSINQETLPKINTALDKMQEAMDNIGESLGPDSAINYNSRRITDELSVVIRSIRSLLEYLERDPQALIFGKEGVDK